MSANVAILVHGTFASEATWIESDSALAQQLRNVMPEIECVPFRWSGANNHSARLAASDALAETIHDVADRYPRAAIHLVGHSHGGNVMLYASGKIGPRPKIATMSFLGTPFLIPVLREVVGRMAFAKNAAGFVFLFLGVFLSALVTVWASEHFPADTLAAGMFFFGMILAGIVFASFMMKLAHWLVPKLEMAILNRQAEAMAALVLPRPHCPIFIASVGYDEAGLLLNFWDRLTFVPQAIVDLAREVVGGAVIGVGSAFVLSLFGAAIEGFAEGFGYDIKWFDGLPVAAATFLLLLFYAATAVMIFGLCAVLAASLFRGSRIAFGGEDPLFIAGIRVVAMTSPDWTPLPGSQYRSYEVSGSLRQLRHSMFYESRDVLHDMARWIVRPPTEAAPSWPRPTSASEKSGIVTSMSTWIAFLATIAFALFGYLNPEAFAAINAFLVPD